MGHPEAASSTPGPPTPQPGRLHTSQGRRVPAALGTLQQWAGGSPEPKQHLTVPAPHRAREPGQCTRARGGAAECRPVYSGSTSSPRTSRHHDRQKGQLCNHARSRLPAPEIQPGRPGPGLRLLWPSGQAWAPTAILLIGVDARLTDTGHSRGRGRALKIARLAMEGLFRILRVPLFLVLRPQGHTGWYPGILSSQRLMPR